MNFKETLEKKFNIRDGKINNFLSIRNDRLFYKDLDLYEMAKKYGAPLEVAYTDAIRERIDTLKGIFHEAILKNNYKGQFIYTYACKANQYEEVIRSALKAGAHLETSFSYDLSIARLMRKVGYLPPDRLLICSGFKVGDYPDKIIQLKREGFKNIIPVIDNIAEIDLFKNVKVPLKVGVRQRIDKGVVTKKATARVYHRFGLPYSELVLAAKKISKYKNLKLVMYHAMLGSQIEEEDIFLKSLLFATKCYAELKKQYSSLQYLNFGGGIPVQYSLDFNFDYQHFTNELVKGIKEICQKAKVEEPIIIFECGRYTIAEHGFVLFKILMEKTSFRKDARWYIANSSLMNELPDAWALGQSFLVFPLNNYNLKPKKVLLGGITCDGVDIYRIANMGGDFLTLPEMGKELYIGFFNTGAYQEPISGIGGVHHCLIPEPKELIIDKIGKKYKYHVITKAQSKKKVLKTLGYQNYYKYLRDLGF